jgi:hypothetical protein
VKFNRAEAVSSDDTNSNGRLAILADGSQLLESRITGDVPPSTQVSGLRVYQDLDAFQGIQLA